MCCLFMEFQGLIDCILVLKSTLLSVAENGDKLGVETFSIAIVTAALTDGSEMSLLYMYTILTRIILRRNLANPHYEMKLYCMLCVY